MQQNSIRPHILLSLLEFRAPFEALATAVTLSVLKKAPKGDGQPVLVIPGFLTSDGATYALRKYLNEQGFSTHAWGLGINPGLRIDIFEQLSLIVEDIYERHGQKVSIVGWSLGGIYARVLGHRFPSKVRQVITLGSPFALNNTFSTDEVGVSGPVIRLYERLNPNLKSDPLVNGDPLWETPPPVPSTAIYSEDDGVTSWKYCIDTISERAENIRVIGSHMGLTHNPLVLYALADRLAQPLNTWQAFSFNGIRKYFYYRPRNHRTHLR